MEKSADLSLRNPKTNRSVETEIIWFFKANSFLMVSEARLASLLCRPPDMVSEAVKELEGAGILTRREGGTLLGIEEGLAGVEP